jgi:hypothetical protein
MVRVKIGGSVDSHRNPSKDTVLDIITQLNIIDN